jgi:hypothetical protein
MVECSLFRAPFQQITDWFLRESEWIRAAGMIPIYKLRATGEYRYGGVGGLSVGAYQIVTAVHLRPEGMDSAI